MGVSFLVQVPRRLGEKDRGPLQLFSVREALCKALILRESTHRWREISWWELSAAQEERNWGILA